MRTKEQATKKAKALLAKMPKRKGWRIRVWENLGWHYEVRNDYVSVSEEAARRGAISYPTTRYHAMISDQPDGHGSPSRWCPPERLAYSDPVTAVREALRLVEIQRDTTISICNKVIKSIQEDLEGGK